MTVAFLLTVALEATGFVVVLTTGCGANLVTLGLLAMSIVRPFVAGLMTGFAGVGFLVARRLRVVDFCKVELCTVLTPTATRLLAVVAVAAGFLTGAGVAGSLVTGLGLGSCLGCSPLTGKPVTASY